MALGGSVGGGAAPIKAGSAYVSFATSSAGMGPGLKETEAKLKEFSQKSRAVLSQAGRLGGVGEALGFGGGIGTLAVAANAAATMAANMQELNEAIARGNKLSEEFNERWGHMKVAEKLIAATKDWRDGMGGIDRVGRADALAKGLEVAQKNAGGLESELRKARDDLAAMETFAHRQARGIPGIVGAVQQENYDEAKRRVDELSKRHKEATEAVGLLKRELRDTKYPHTSDEMLGRVRSLTDRIREQGETFGMTAEQIEVYRLKRDGASAAQVADLESQARGAELFKSQQSAREELKKLTESLKLQAQTFEMTGEQAQIYALRVKGAITEAEAADATAAAAEVERLRTRAENVRKAFRAAFGPKDKPAEKEAATRGAFVGHGSLESVFGAGAGGVMGKQLTELKAANTEAKKQTSALNEMIEAVRNMPGPAWGW
jgi:hypothetical protein